MAHSKPSLILALLLLNTACPAAGATVMRVHTNGEVEALQSDSVTSLENIFSDDPEAKAMTAKLLEGTPSEDLLPFVQKLKEQILPWHDSATASLTTAIEEVKSCISGMENGMREADAKKDSCSAQSTSHTTHRTEESTKFTTKEHWKAETAEKKETKTTECNAFKTVEDEAKSATASYGGGDEGAYLESVSQKFCSDLLPRYKDHKEKCTIATAEHTRVSGIYETKTNEYTVQKTASDTVQTDMDVTCCEYSLATKGVCTAHDTCYEDKVAAYNAVKTIVEAEEKVKKTEWRVYSRIECLLPILGTDNAASIETCRAKTHDTSHLDIEYPAIPEKSACPVDEAFPGTDAYHNTHFASLSNNAKGKAVAECTGMSTGSTSIASIAMPSEYAATFSGNDMDGWNCGAIQTCGSLGSICGGHNQKGKDSSIEKSVSLAAGTYKVTLDFIKVDSWDNEEGLVYVNGEECWRKHIRGEGSQQCGAGHNHWFEEMYPVECSNIEVNAGEPLTIKVTSTLDQGSNDESYGISNVLITRQ